MFWGVRIERETIRARNDLFVDRFARLEPELEKKSPVNRVTQRLSSEFVNFAFNIFFTVL